MCTTYINKISKISVICATFIVANMSFAASFNNVGLLTQDNYTNTQLTSADLSNVPSAIDGNVTNSQAIADGSREVWKTSALIPTEPDGTAAMKPSESMTTGQAITERITLGSSMIVAATSAAWFVSSSSSSTYAHCT